MNNEDFNRLVEQLPLLTKAQQTDVRHRLAALIGEVAVGQQSDWVLDGLLKVLTERGRGDMTPAGFRIRKADSFAGFETQSDRVRRMLSHAVPEMTLTERRSLGALAARCLADYIQSWSENNEISLDNMLRHTKHIPVAIDRAFPGYLETGMLGWLIGRRPQKMSLTSVQASPI